MFNRFSERAKQAIQIANNEAKDMKHHYIGTEHVVLGVIKTVDGNGSKLLKKMAVDYDVLKKRLWDLLERGIV